MEENKKIEDWSAIAGVIIVIVILLVGAFYFAGQRIEKSKEFKAEIQKGMAPISTSSDAISDIEKDANSVNADNLGAGIENL